MGSTKIHLENSTECMHPSDLKITPGTLLPGMYVCWGWEIGQNYHSFKKLRKPGLEVRVKYLGYSVDQDSAVEVIWESVHKKDKSMHTIILNRICICR